MNFTPLNLFNFQPIGKNENRKRGKFELAIRSARIDLSKATYEAIGKPESIQIGTDDHFLAIWAEPDAFQANLARGASGASICGTDTVKRLKGRLAKLEEIDFRTQYAILSEPVFENGKLIYDIDKLTVCTKQVRRSA